MSGPPEAAGRSIGLPGDLPGGTGPHPKYDGVQILRAAAALFVLVEHAPQVAAASWGWLLPYTDGGGAIGVDLFFVISGFVLAMSAEKPGATAGGFLLDRATRLLPLYLIASLPFLAFGSTSSWREVWNTLAFLPVFDRDAYVRPSHPFGWSLAAEVWFYLAFALVLRSTPAGARAAALAAAAAVLVAAGCFFGGEGVLLRFFGMPMFLEFAAGALLFRYRTALGRAQAAVLTPSGVLLVFWFAGALPDLGHHHGFAVSGGVAPDTGLAMARALLWGSAAALLVAGAVALDRSGFRCWPAALVRVGDRSYSVYLVQPFAIMLLEPLAWPHFLAGWAALLALTLAIAWASHRWIERPATGWLRARLGARTPEPAAAGGTAPPGPGLTPWPWPDRSLP